MLGTKTVFCPRGALAYIIFSVGHAIKTKPDQNLLFYLLNFFSHNYKLPECEENYHQKTKQKQNSYSPNCGNLKMPNSSIPIYFQSTSQRPFRSPFSHLDI